MRKISKLSRLVAALAIAAIAAVSAGAQQVQKEKGKLLFLIVSGPDAFGSSRVMLALRHAVQLKNSGHTVEIVFQSDGVYSLGAIAGAGSPPAPEQEGAQGSQSTGGSVKRSVLDNNPNAKDLLSKIKALNIPYKACAQSASVRNIFQELSRAGVPLSQDKEKLIRLDEYISSGYQIMVF